jgi:Mg/Co/Ni transporter MgtE
MWEHDCGALPVVDAENKVLGMVTDRDIAMCAYLQGKPLSDIPVTTAMSDKVVSCSPDDTVAAAEQRMGKAKVRRLPVIDKSGALVGILSLDDIVRGVVLAPRHVGPPHATDVVRTLASIYEPRVGPSRGPTKPAATMPAPGREDAPRPR